MSTITISHGFLATSEYCIFRWMIVFLSKKHFEPLRVNPAGGTLLRTRWRSLM